MTLTRRRCVGAGLAGPLSGLMPWALSSTLSGCVAVKIGSDAPSQAYLALGDPGLGGVVRRSAPLLPALLVQPLAAGSIVDSTAIVYSRSPGSFATYQFSSWTEQPVRRLPQLLRERLDARGIAGATVLLGDPVAADWLLRGGFEALHHDASSEPGQARVALGAELLQRRERRLLARQRFTADVPLARADAAAAVAAMSQALARIFDQLLPWLEARLESQRVSRLDAQPGIPPDAAR